MTYKNHALDNFLKDCLAKVSSPDVKIVRVGTLPEDADYRLRKCLLYEVCSPINQKYKIHEFRDYMISCKNGSQQILENL